MVTTRIKLLLLAALASSLPGACGFLTASTFSVSETQLAAQKDFSADIPEGSGGDFTLSTVSAGGVDLVFLACQKPFDGIHLIVMDRDLQVLQKFTYQQLALSPPNPLGNTGAFLGTLGDVLILGLDCAATSAGLTGFGPISTAPGGAFSLTDGTSNFAGFSAYGNTLTFSAYNTAWQFVSTLSATISSNPSLSFNLIGVQQDPSTGMAAFIFESNGTSQDYFFLIPVASLAALTPAPALDTLYLRFTTSRADNQLAAYSQNGFISFQRTPNGPGGKFIRLDTSGNTLSWSLPYSDDTNVHLATRAAGGWYFDYNRDTRVVRKFTAWWGP